MSRYRCQARHCAENHASRQAAHCAGPYLCHRVDPPCPSHRAPTDVCAGNPPWMAPALWRCRAERCAGVHTRASAVCDNPDQEPIFVCELVEPPCPGHVHPEGRCAPMAASALAAAAAAGIGPAEEPCIPCLMARLTRCDFTDVLLVEVQNAREAVWSWSGGRWQRGSHQFLKRGVSARGESSRPRFDTLKPGTPHGTEERALQVIAAPAGSARPTLLELMVRSDHPLCAGDLHPRVLVDGPGITQPEYRGRGAVGSIRFEVTSAPSSRTRSFFARFWPLLMAPARYTVDIEACGTRERGTPLGRQRLVVLAYPAFQCGLKISIPSMIKKTYKRERIHGLTAYTDTTERSDKDRRLGQENTSSLRRQDGMLGSSTTEGSSQTHWGRSGGTGGAFDKYTSERRTITDLTGGQSTSEKETYVFGHDAKNRRHTVDPAAPGGIKIDEEPIAFGDKIGIELNLNDQDMGFPVAIVTAIDRVRKAGQTLNEIVEAIKNVVPGVGWTVSWELSFLSGSIEASWRLKEHTDHRVFVNVQAAIALALVEGSFEIAFGLQMPLFTAQVFGRAAGRIACEGRIEHNNPDSSFIDGGSIGLVGSFDGTLGARVQAGPSCLRIYEGEAGVRVGFEVKGGFRVSADKGPHLGYDLTWKAGVLYYQHKAVDGIVAAGDEYLVWEETPLLAGTLPAED